MPKYNSAKRTARIDDKQTSKRILAAIFLALITLVALVQIRMTIIQTRAFLDNYTKDSNTKLTSYTKTIESAYEGILTYTNAIPVINRGSYINFNGFMANAMGVRNLNNVIKLNNGHLGETQVLRDVTKDVVQITKLSEYAKENGKSFLYVVGPSQFSVSNEELPAGYETFVNENADAQITGSRNNDVSVLDLRVKMQEQGLTPTEMMFTTDHHWNVKAGFWGYTEIIKKLVDGDIIQADSELVNLTDIDNYRVETLRDVFLGAYGRRTGVYFAGLDDFDIFTPMFDTNLTVTLFPDNIQKSGSFYDVCYSSHYDPKKKPSPGSPGGVSEHMYGYWGAAPQGAQYHNDGAPINKRILVLSNSFGSFPNAFLALTFTDLAQVYFNRNSQWDGTNFEKYLMEFNPDIIIFLTNSGLNIGIYDFLPTYNLEVK